MDATIQRPAEDLSLDLESELELWTWAQAAGVSADELRQALQGSSPTPELRKAA
jgi:hypothetical protein